MPSLRDAYNAEVLERFARPPLPLAGAVRVVAGRQADGIVVELCADRRGECVDAPGFRVWGCPHIIAACALLAERLDGEPVSALQRAALTALPAQLRETLDIPAEKAGKILILIEAWVELGAALGAASDAEAG